MTPTQLQSIKDRSVEVINGFKQSSVQNARDALVLAYEVESLGRKIVALELLKATKKPVPPPDFLRGLGL